MESTANMELDRTEDRDLLHVQAVLCSNSPGLLCFLVTSRNRKKLRSWNLSGTETLSFLLSVWDNRSSLLKTTFSGFDLSVAADGEIALPSSSPVGGLPPLKPRRSH